MSKQAFIMLCESDQDWIVFRRFFFLPLSLRKQLGVWVQKTTQDNGGGEPMNQWGVWGLGPHPWVSWEKVKRYSPQSGGSLKGLLGQEPVSSFSSHTYNEMPHKQGTNSNITHNIRHDDTCASHVILPWIYFGFLYNLINTYLQ